MNRFSILVTAFVITACAGVKGMFGGAIQTYSGPAKPNTEVATLVFQTVTWSVRGKANAHLGKLDGIAYGSDAQGYGDLAKALSGKHELEVYCFVAGLKATPRITINLEAAKTYEIRCIDDGTGIARVEYKLAEGSAAK